MLRVFSNKNDARIVRRIYVSVTPKIRVPKEFNLGNIPYTATEIPPGFPEDGSVLSDREKVELQEKFFDLAPAKLKEQQRAELEKRLDPQEHLNAARDALQEIVARSTERAVDMEVLQGLLALLLRVRCEDPTFCLEAATMSVLAAVEKAEAGAFGVRPDGVNLADMPVNQVRSKLSEALGQLVAPLRRYGLTKKETHQGSGRRPKTAAR
ncbi:hypothetical protein ACQ858_14920 [Variovorax ureilyticus]|uniref:hypothetical protein n=1 Tax=Variovorax ureilyticus TaxID=1836198 RepID=UPI003D66FB7A